MCSLYLCSKMFSHRLLINSSCNGIFLRWSAADLMCWIDHQLDGQDCSGPALQGKAQRSLETEVDGGLATRLIYGHPFLSCPSPNQRLD